MTIEHNSTNTEAATFINSGDKGAGVARLTRMEKARRELKAIAKDLRSNALLSLAERIEAVEATLHNRTPVRNGQRIVSAPMTHKLRQEIKTYAEGNPDITFAEIGRTFNVAGARVSEIVAGLRQ